MAGEQYRYLENQGGGNHLIIRNNVTTALSFDVQNDYLDNWYTGVLASEVRAMVQPVRENFATGNVESDAIAWLEAWRWLPSNIDDFPEVAADITQVDTSGTRRAFALSLADVARLSGSGRAFPSRASREGPGSMWWWTRTPAVPGTSAWDVNRGEMSGMLSNRATNNISAVGGVRPALIIRQ
ncbi:hypothetical protein [Lactococcus ileimucosae]